LPDAGVSGLNLTPQGTGRRLYLLRRARLWCGRCHFRRDAGSAREI